MLLMDTVCASYRKTNRCWFPLFFCLAEKDSLFFQCFLKWRLSA